MVELINSRNKKVKYKTKTTDSKLAEFVRRLKIYFANWQWL